MCPEVDVLGATEPNQTMLTMAEQRQQQQQRQQHAESVESTSIETTTTTTAGPTLIPDNEASRSAVAASSDKSLRVPCYCEENVWRLACRKIHQCDTSASSSSFFAVFISSKTKVVPMFYQRASRDPYNEACLWDYHVVLLEERRQEYWIHDVDCVLSTNKPIPLQHYLRHCFPVNVTDDYTPLFRLIRADMYLQHFASDRSHMYRNGKWSAPPPTYSCIQPQDKRMGMNLDKYRFMTNGPTGMTRLPGDDTIGLDNGVVPPEPYGVVWTMQQLEKHTTT